MPDPIAEEDAGIDESAVESLALSSGANACLPTPAVQRHGPIGVEGVPRVSFVSP